ncbi:CotO family spore coat protein [Bacillus sp. T33-2]|uniref:CotO family spore coat protein n=1 Tax=Bacillus sp. T33-2 TaxID=2054168 RepID=UPI000C765D75|nr:CotO family spore coat protein [Bacillus sp. T33-2]PLR97592.1 hypothetical protein CVD19_08935 [Bacillus sp. T33-2]
MSERKTRREPLLYIHQPMIKPPDFKMQQTYSTKKAKNREAEVPLDQGPAATEPAKQGPAPEMKPEIKPEIKPEMKPEVKQEVKKEIRKRRAFSGPLENDDQESIFGRQPHAKSSKADSKHDLEQTEVVQKAAADSSEPAQKTAASETRNPVAEKSNLNNEELYVESKNQIFKQERKRNSSFKSVPRGQYSFQRVKSFREMTIPERLSYLEGFPKQLPPVACTFKTGDKVYKGFLSKRNEDTIEIEDFENTIISLNIDGIKEINIVGY